MKLNAIITLCLSLVAGSIVAQDIELLPIGNFTKIGKSGAHGNWHAQGFAGIPGNTLEWIASADGRVFGRLTADHPDNRYFICQTRNAIQINASWTDLELKAVYRVHDMRPEAASWQNFRFSVTWYDDMGNTIAAPGGSNLFFKESASTGDWKVNAAAVKKPANATSFKLDFGSQGAALIADVAQISLKPVGISVESSPIPTL